MALRRKEPVTRERGSTPLVYFKGNIHSLSKLPLNEVVREFGRVALPYKTHGEIFSTARVFLEGAIAQARELAHSGNREANFALSGPMWRLLFRIKMLPSGRVLIHQQPVYHGIGRDWGTNSFNTLLGIIAKGFHSPAQLEDDVHTISFGEEPRYTNVIARRTRRHVGEHATADTSVEVTSGDRYAIEMMAHMKHEGGVNYSPVHSMESEEFIRSAHPSQILRINIMLTPGASTEGIVKKIEFYRQALKGWPVHFIAAKK
ncbi:MAG TPA: hypothetical protein VJI13_00500 [Candidatus Norongarragalinales archaeon]|nr:hypothetical protein [Candidatus Norongarragalinales archaeon]